MRLFKGLFWLLVVAAVIAGAVHLTGHYELADRLTGLFLTAQAWLPLTLHFEHFLVVLTVASFLTALLTVSACAALLVRFSARQQRKLAQTAAVHLEISHLKD